MNDEPLNYKNLSAKQIQKILDAKTDHPEKYEKYIEEIKESGYFNKGDQKND